MGTLLRDRRDVDEELHLPPPPPPRQPPLIETIEELQRRAGNRAVTAALARQPADAPFAFDPLVTQPGAPPSLTAGLGPAYAQRRAAEVTAKIAAHVQQQRGPLELRVRQGVSIAEIMDAVITGVPEARELPPATLAAELRRLFAPLVIREHRDGMSAAGVRSEVEAQARVALPSLTKKPEIPESGPGGYMKIGLSGLAVGVRRGESQVEAEAGWTGSARLMTKVGRVQFEAKLSPPTGDGAPEWEVVLQFPGDEGLVPALDSLPKVFGEAERGLRHAAGELVRKGDRGIASAASQLGGVKTAVEALSAIAATPGGPRVGVKAEGQGPAVTLQATLTITF